MFEEKNKMNWILKESSKKFFRNAEKRKRKEKERREGEEGEHEKQWRNTKHEELVTQDWSESHWPQQQKLDRFCWFDTMTWIFKCVVENYSCSKAKMFRFLWTYFKGGSNETDDQSTPHLLHQHIVADRSEQWFTGSGNNWKGHQGPHQRTTKESKEQHSQKTGNY